MAEIATIARPYAEALFKVGGVDKPSVAAEVRILAGIAGNPQVRQVADNPKVGADRLFDLITSVLKSPVSVLATNLLRTVIDNGRLSALPEIAAQYQALVNASSGVSDATIYSAFDIAPAQLAEVVAALERRFKRKLNASVVVEPDLIGGIRVVVGDEVLDTSVRARLEQMRVALTA